MIDPKTDKRVFFKDFFKEFRAGLRVEDQSALDKLVQDLTDISALISPLNGKEYTFREVIMLTALINQKKIETLKPKIKG